MCERGAGLVFFLSLSVGLGIGIVFEFEFNSFVSGLNKCFF